MSRDAVVGKENSEESRIKIFIKREWKCLKECVNKFLLKWWGGIFIIFSVVAFTIPPVWYSAWFPDAQQNLYQLMKDELNNEEEKKSIKKPGFFYVSGHHVNDWGSPNPWMLLFTFFYICAQLKQFNISYKNNSILEDKNKLEIEVNLANNSIEKKNREFEDFKIKAREELSNEKMEHDVTRKHYAYSVKQELQNFFTQHAWFDQNSCRFSLYTFDKSFSSAHLIHRYCKISFLEKKGRLSISAKDGAIAAALNNGDSVWINVLKHSGKNDKRYRAEIRKYLWDNYRTSVLDDTFNDVRMKSSVYYCRAIRRQNGIDLEKFAVFVIESENPKAFSEELVDGVFSGKIDSLYRMVDHLSRLEAVMNPIKEGA